MLLNAQIKNYELQIVQKDVFASSDGNRKAKNRKRKKLCSKVHLVSKVVGYYVGFYLFMFVFYRQSIYRIHFRSSLTIQKRNHKLNKMRHKN